MVKPNHRTLTTTFLDAGTLKKLKNNLKSSGIQNKQLSHYLQMTYRIINDLESAQAEHRWYPKLARPAHKDYVNTVEFVRLVAQIVSGHILSAVCGASEGSPKADEDSIAKRLLNELLSHTGATNEGSSSHTHGDHIQSGVANAVAEMLTAAKETGGLPGVTNVAKTTLSSEAEAERRRRGAAAAALLASGKQNYDYCNTGKLNLRAKRYEVPKFVRRKSNHNRTDAAVLDEKRMSSDGVKSKENSRTAIKAPIRPKMDKPGNGKEQESAYTQNDARKVRLEKTIGSRTDQNRPTNVNRTNYASKINSRKTVGEGIKSRSSKSIFTMKTRGRIPPKSAIGDNAVNNTRSLKQSELESGANSQLQQKNISRGKPAVDEPNKARRVQLEKTIGFPTDQKRPTNGRINDASKVDARKTASEGIKSKNNKNIFTMKTRDRIPLKTTIGDNAVNNIQSQKRSDVVRRVTTKDDRKKLDDSVLKIVTDKNRKPGRTGALINDAVGTRGTQGKTGPLADLEENDDKDRKLYNRNRTIIIGGNGAAEKSKTTRARNSASVVKKSKNPMTKNGTKISPTIDYHDNALRKAPRGGINKPVNTKRIFSVAETIDHPRVPANVRDNDFNGGGRVVSGGVGGGGGVGTGVGGGSGGGVGGGFSGGVGGGGGVGTGVGGGGGVGTVVGTGVGGRFGTGVGGGIGTGVGSIVGIGIGGGSGGGGVGGGFSDGGVGGGGVGGVSGGGGRGVGKNVVPSKTLISPTIDYLDDASLTATHDGINEPVDKKRMFSVAETIDTPRVPADVRDDDDGAGGFGGGVGGGRKNAVNQDTGEDRIFDERYRTGPDNSETGRNRISERNQDGICNKTTMLTATNGAGSHRIDNFMDDDIYKLRIACVLGKLDQCQNRETGLYQAKRKGSKYEVTDLTENEYCKLKNM